MPPDVEANISPNEPQYPSTATLNLGDSSEPLRTQAVFIRSDDEVGAMGQMDRFKARLRGVVRKICCIRTEKSLVEKSRRKQYRLEAASRRWWCGRSRHTTLGMSVSRGKLSLAMYLHWMFRVNFFFLFSLSCVVFFALTIFFAGLIIAAGRLDKDCVRVGGQPFESAGTAFADAFALSWTTFSTVGYGSTYPALGHENNNPTNCMFITAICSLESFIGVLYSGFCGAILFGKVLRIQSHAQVIFSDPIVIRYGSGVDSPVDEDEEEYTETGKKKIPCPVLEFRIINRLFNDAGGEIIDASLNVVASIDADDAENLDSIHDSLRYSNRASSLSDSSHDASSINEVALRFIEKLKLKSGHSGHTALEEDPSTRIVNKKIFSKMFLEASDHPFFKRVWLVRHVLDENSPILKRKARRSIRKCGGYWPENLNSYQGVHESLAFNQILVSLNGVSNVSASDVYAQKIYDFVDVNVGYQFVNLLYRDGDVLKVDTDLINDVKEQNGGGGEPLTFLPGEGQ